MRGVEGQRHGGIAQGVGQALLEEILYDDDGVRADMTASWLAQMGWEVYVTDPVDASARSATGPWHAPTADTPAVRTVDARALAGWLEAEGMSAEFAP